MIDGLTGWSEAVPIVDQSAANVTRAVYNEWFARYGVPEQLHSDRGTQFEAALFAELCSTVGTDNTRSTPYRPMRLPVDVGTPLPEPPRDVQTFAADLAEDLEWSYKVAREVIGHGHRRAESLYNERVVERAYPRGTRVRVLLHAHPRNVLSKLDTNYSGLCKVIETRGSLLTLRELDTQRVFTANHDAVRRSTVTRPAAPPAHAARAAPLHPVARAAPQLPPQQAAPPIPPAPHTVHRHLASRVAQSNPVQSAPHSHARAICDLRDVSPLPPFGSPAVLPQQPPRRSTVRRKKRRNTRAHVAQPLAPTAQSTQVPRPPPLMDLRISAPPSPVPRVASPLLRNRRALPANAQHPASAQPHLYALRKKPRTDVCILNAENDTPLSPPSSLSPPSPPRATRSMNALVEDHNSRVAVTSTAQFIGTSASSASSSSSAASAASRASYCYAVSLRSHDENDRSSYTLLSTRQSTTRSGSCAAAP